MGLISKISKSNRAKQPATMFSVHSPPADAPTTPAIPPPAAEIPVTTTLDDLQNPCSPVLQTEACESSPCGWCETLQAAAESAGGRVDSTTLQLPPTVACPICSCPAIWISIYEDPYAAGAADAWKCCDCDPPPGGWHWREGGWSFVARRMMLILDDFQGVEKWTWENFPRVNWAEELRAA